MVYTDDATWAGAPSSRMSTPAERARFSLTDDEVEELARHALIIEEHYGRPMDIEWGKDGVDGELYILQARPETVQSRGRRHVMRRFVLEGTERRRRGPRDRPEDRRRRGAGDDLDRPDARVPSGEVLVADMTDPDWEPIMKRASAIVTNRGGRTCHAAIIARELGIPAVVGTGDGHPRAAATAARSRSRAPRATPASSTTAS